LLDGGAGLLVLSVCFGVAAVFVFFAAENWRRERKVLCLGRVRGLELGLGCSSVHCRTAYAAGGYFFRFAGKSNQKGATSFRKKQIFFMPGRLVSCKQVRAHTARSAVVTANASAPPHAGAKPVRG
jgi:hypothetical protein